MFIFLTIFLYLQQCIINLYHFYNKEYAMWKCYACRTCVLFPVYLIEFISKQGFKTIY